MKIKAIGIILLLGMIGAGFTLFYRHYEYQTDFHTNSKELTDSISLTIDTIAYEQKLYELPVEDKIVITDKIKPNQRLSEILLPHNIEYKYIHELAEKSKTVFDVRKLAFNHQYTLICKEDSLQTVEQMIYEIDPVDYVVFNLKDSVSVYRGAKPVEIVEKHLTGTIDYSLYQTMMDEGASPLLSHELSEIFAWQVDFFHIQKGDRFKIIYQEKQVDGHPVGIANIDGAYFQHAGNDYWAVFYQQGEKDSYFDEEGNSLRKAFLKAPLKYSRISSSFSRRRFHPVQKRWKSHLGTDYAAPTGTPIMSVGDGVIQEAQYKRYNGNYVKVRHNGTFTTQYLHMSKIAKGIRPGVRVKQGQVIGYVGSTGLATGPHCCFRFWKNGQQVDPRRQKIPSAKPIDESEKENYFAARDAMMARLNALSFQHHLPKNLFEEVEGICIEELPYNL
ncbi:peptidoglycan DD-metalloendopeptidase family protein [Persicobacter sp. CCB-QB2]|uniref:M23 family metallopeptidase n=1 Tax=Persicobacter sp. CCB-QB2 TaxID=1561025 RepID=UPI0009E45BF4|nr:peptidoglycan DD-metalloendopeptidase family protein [Persicobacter sp. CCB-QB2]